MGLCVDFVGCWYVFGKRGIEFVVDSVGVVGW